MVLALLVVLLRARIISLASGTPRIRGQLRVRLARASVWRLLTGRLGWSLQRPRRQAVERDESEIARWVAHEWPRIKRGR
ncbi:winged helix-turn-helix domain-containing protein [Streptomyces anandii]|uniref:winged helix-turn-helix domain-containing protein n=1 Tax=Streptomyces anandii TaxID=285454 RepID=UPI0036C90B5C